MIGNFCVESGATTNGGDINPLARSGFQDENSFGIAQWNPAKAAGERFKQLVQYSSRIGLNYNTIEAQLRFVIRKIKRARRLPLTLLVQVRVLVRVRGLLLV